MSVCGQNGHAEEDSGSEEVTASAAAVRDIYKQKPVSKVVRVMTVLAYLLSVSLAAILLSVYYVCVWRSPELPALNGTGSGSGGLAALRHPHDPAAAARHQMHSDMHPGNPPRDSGGGDSGVKALVDSVPATTELSTDSTTEVLLEFSTDSTFAPESLNSTFGSGTNDTELT